METITEIQQSVRPNIVEPNIVQPNIVEPNASVLVQLQLQSTTVDVDTQFDLLQQSLTKFKTNLSDIQQQLRVLEKTIKMDKKKEQKETKEQKESKPKELKQTKIIGFDVQEKITDELSTFMTLPLGSTTTRNAVTAFITEYIRSNKLQDMTDRKRIHLNSELATVFNLTTADVMTYFKLHNYISKLFL
jgi:chromatin remodeling complex protein RSC6